MEIISKNNVNDKLEGFLNKIEIPKNNRQPDAYNHCVRADALRIQNHFKESIEEYLKAVSYDECNYEVYKGLGLSYKHTCDIINAVTAFEKAKRLFSFDKTIYYELACCYCHLSKFSKSFDNIKKAIKLDPNYLDAQLQLAVIHEAANEIDMALKVYQKIISERPSYIAAYNNLGSLYIRLGLLNNAVNTFRNLLRINPDFSRAYLGIAISYDKMDCKTEAIRFYKKYMDLKPNSANIPYVIERISELKTEKKTARKDHLKLVTV